MAMSWYAEPELLSTTFSVSHGANNLSKVDHVLAYAHMDDVVYVNSSQSPYTTHKLPLQGKPLVHQVRVCSLQGATFVVVASDRGVQIFDSKGEKRVYELVLKDNVEVVEEGDALFCRGICAIDSDRPGIAVGSSVGKVFILGKERSAKASTTEHEFDLLETLSDHKEAIQSADSSKNGTLLATSDDSGTILVCNPDETFAIVHRVTGDGYPAMSIRFTPENLMVCGYLTGIIRIFRKKDYRLHAEIAAHSRAITAIDTSDKYIVSVGEDTFINVWELVGDSATPRIRLASAHSVTNDLLTGVCFAGPKTVLTAAYDTTHLKLWVPE